MALLKEANYISPQLDPDEAQWSEILLGADDKRKPTPASLKNMRDRSRELALSNPIARTVYRSHVKYIIGKGMTFTSKIKEQPDLFAKIKTVWDNWKKKNKFRNKQREIVNRAVRDGETFIHWSETEEGAAMRFLDPGKFKDPSNNHTYGIETDPEDVETVIAYHYLPEGSTDAIRIPANEIQHIKIQADSDVKRGIPILSTIINRIKQYDSWLTDRLILNKVRAAIALVKSHEGTGPDALAAFADASADSTYVEPKTGNTVRRKRLRPGTIIEAPAGTKYEMLSPNVQASDVRHDGRAILLSIGTGTDLTEPMVSGDAANANYSSTHIAEAPAIMSFMDWQWFFAEEFEEIWERVMIWAVENGELPAEVLEAGVLVSPQRIVYRDRLKDAQADGIYMDRKVISPQQGSRNDGQDWDEMQEEWDKAKNRNGEDSEADEGDIGAKADGAAAASLAVLARDLAQADELKKAQGDEADNKKKEG